jgi:hypothetical protein
MVTLRVAQLLGDLSRHMAGSASCFQLEGAIFEVVDAVGRPRSVLAVCGCRFGLVLSRLGQTLACAEHCCPSSAAFDR